MKTSRSPSRSPAATCLRIPTSSPAEVEAILDLAAELKATRSRACRGSTLGLFFAPALDAHADLVLGRDRPARRHARSRCCRSEMQLSRGESLEDTAQVLSRYLDALAIRTLSHAELEAWADGGRRSR